MKKTTTLLFLFLLSVGAFAQCQLLFKFSPNDTICVGQPTAVSIANTGFTGTVIWSGGDLPTPASGTAINVTPTASQTYVVNWTNGTCTVTDSVKLIVTPVQALLLGKTNPSCGKSNGSINALATGTSLVFTYFKDGLYYSDGKSVLTNAPPGVYDFAVFDNITGCSDTIKGIALIDNSSFPSFTNIQTTGVACFGDKSGSIQVTVTGGTGTYTYSWSHDATNKTNTAQNLTSGTPYTITVNDGGCLPIDTTITLSGPTDSVKLNLVSTADNCQQGNGKLVTNITGGTPPYNFQWSTGSTNADSLTGIVGPTRMDVTVTDNNGCSVSGTDSIFNTGSPSFKVQKVDSSCITGNNGSIAIAPLSNDGPFSYVWSHDPLLTDAVAKNLAPGNYTISAYNSFNCAQVINVTVPAFNGSFFDLGVDQRIQLGQTAQIEVKTDAAIKTITWTPSNVSINDEKKYYTSPTVTTIFSATATYGKGCLLNDQTTIYVDTIESKLVVPTIFTPNGDGVNDNFYVKYDGIKTFQIWIYNRWGAKVFESTDVDFQWNGQNSQTNNLEMDGNYGYTIAYSTYTQPVKQIINGYVTLVK